MDLSLRPLIKSKFYNPFEASDIFEAKITKQTSGI
jgi:hypothetical protein